MRIHRIKATTPVVMITVMLLLTGCGGGEEPAQSRPAPPPKTEAAAVDGVIVAVGDSLTAGYGLSEEAAYPAVLERRLNDAGYRFQVVNAGISGETSSGTRSRIDWIMTLSPDIVILETGANDGLRGIDPALTRDNVDAIVAELNRQGVVVVLAGMKMVKNMGPAFTKSFEEIYPAVAAARKVILVPFFLEGVAGEQSLNQSDGIHPTAKGYEKVVDVVLPYAIEAVERLRSKKK